MEHCELCQREVSKTTKHHLIPRTNHKNKWFKKNFNFEDLHTTVDLCRDCHRQIHKFIPEKEMGRNYNSLEKLLAHQQIAKFVQWLQARAK